MVVTAVMVVMEDVAGEMAAMVATVVLEEKEAMEGVEDYHLVQGVMEEVVEMEATKPINISEAGCFLKNDRFFL
jgi:hypothetical protein